MEWVIGYLIVSTIAGCVFNHYEDKRMRGQGE
jgi:hypothetical protein